MIGRAFFRLAALVAFITGIGATGGVPPRTVLDLQARRETQSIAIPASAGGGTATLVNLNPEVGAWYVLTIARLDGAARVYHLENRYPDTQTLRLDAHSRSGLVVVSDAARGCELFGGSAARALEQASASATIFAPLCDGNVYLRNRAAGRHTRLEQAADFLRERIWGGEALLGIGHQILGDRNAEEAAPGPTPRIGGRLLRGTPAAADIDATFAERSIISGNLGITVGNADGALLPGAWYAAAGGPGVYVSMIEPRMIAARILRDGDRRVNPLDATEASTLCYLVAFDLSRFELGYAGGTDHPAVAWSDHMLPQMRTQERGPDGFDTIAPLVATGMVNPDQAARIVATFTGGFKRMHGAFLYGDLARVNRASHYGFVENGTILSSLQPGLATILVLGDGRVEMKTWLAGGEGRGHAIRYARQNGVAIMERDPASAAVVPGRYVTRWGPGNWSGSQDMKLRTIRAAAAIQQTDSARFLIYAVFSAATPSAMARVFQAYRCDYAMMLDMNALEHTYFALHRRSGSRLVLEYLLKGMSVVDRNANGRIVPRFVGAADNRDFFFVMRRGEKAPR